MGARDDVAAKLAALAVAEWSALADAEVPDVVSGVFTTDDWRDMLLIKWFACWRPDLLTDAAGARYRELYGRFRLALTPKLVADLERKTKAGESLTWAEGRLWFAAVAASRPRNRAENRADWRRWYATPVAVSLFARRPEPRHRSLRHARPRGRRVVRRAQARAPDWATRRRS